MCGYIKEIFTLISNFLQNFECLELFFRNLDPSLFQNIILGILAIFIPFAIVLYADMLNSKRQRSEFEKMVLSDEVFGVKKMFILAVLGIVFFALFSGKDIAILAKIIASVVMIFYIFLLGYPFKKILNYSEGNKLGYEIGFLKKLKLSKYIKYKNKNKSKKINRAWNSFWDKKTKYNESEFIEIFISHIDDAIKYKKFNLAKGLSQTYLSNIEKRNKDLMFDEILPKVFEWNEKLMDEMDEMDKYKPKRKIENFIVKRIFRIIKKSNPKIEYFDNWYYFRAVFFQKVTKELLLYCDGLFQYPLFGSVQEYLDKSIGNWNKISDNEKKKKYWKYHIDEFIITFFDVFFNNISDILEQNSDLEYDFPEEWKMTMSNINETISPYIVREFIKWSKNKITKKSNNGKKDNNLTKVIELLFPRIYPNFFLMLFSSSSVKKIIESEPLPLIVDIEEAKKEIIQIIFTFFYEYWPVQIKKLNKLKEEFESEEIIKICNKSKMIYIPLQFVYYLEHWPVQIKKLNKLKKELESKEIIKICKKSEIKEANRKVLLELIELLIEKIKNNIFYLFLQSLYL